MSVVWDMPRLLCMSLPQARPTAGDTVSTLVSALPERMAIVSH